MVVDRYHDGIVEWVEKNTVGASSKEKGDAFCKWCLINLFDLAEDDAIDAMEISGKKDGGIDAVIFREDKIIVIQAKYETSHNWESMTRFDKDITRILDNEVQASEINSNAARAIAQIQDGVSKNIEIEFIYVTSNKFSEVEKIKLNNLISKERLYWDIEAIVQNLETNQQELPERVKEKWFELGLASREILTFADKTAVIAVSLADMHDFVHAGGIELFVSNVRQYLKGSKINKGIRETIQNNANMFWLYNNGITIVCDDFDHESEVAIVRVKTPQIVNGCQTAKSITEIMGRKREEDRRTVQGHVLVRLIKGANPEERENITRYTNLQNAVRGKDFFSLEKFHKDLQRNFKKLGYYYEIQRGAYTSLKSSEKTKYVGHPNWVYLTGSKFKNVVPALEAIQAYASGFKNLPGMAMSRPNDLTPIGSSYDKVFSEDLKPEPRWFLYPILIREWARENGYSRSSEGGWRSYSSWLFIRAYIVLVMSMLREVKIIDMLEQNPEAIGFEIWDMVFGDEELNVGLLKLADDLLERFFLDSGVNEAVGQDVRKFLRTQDMLSKHEKILDRYCEQIIKMPRHKEVIRKISQVFGKA